MSSAVFNIGSNPRIRELRLMVTGNQRRLPHVLRHVGRIQGGVASLSSEPGREINA